MDGKTGIIVVKLWDMPKGIKYPNRKSPPPLTEEHRRKIGIANKGKKRSDETKRKCRLAKIKYLEKCKKINQPLSPTIGKNENQILNRIEQELKTKIVRQFFIDGYFLDGYIPKYNLAIEVDERPKTKQRDIDRQKYIESKLNCKFIRIKDYK